MKKLGIVLIILVVLSVLYGQRESIISLFENQEEAVIRNEVISADVDTSKAKDAALRKEIAGFYDVVYYNADQGGQETYTLYENGACTWAYMGDYKKGWYRITESGLLDIQITGNAGTIHEAFVKNEYGRWSKGNAYLKRRGN